ncbi:mucin-5AC isoform X1 [Macrobrachium rosenbergii]|uniref:mucin-5AC isoform X1 n=1 Tax=Macrobrachium rosenbergii TaxID=79674 RepID=UPI0034D51F65
MAGRWDVFQGLPQGWEVRFDARTGRYYFVDHVDKKTSWEDPRLKNCPPPPPHPETIPPELRNQQENQTLPHYQPIWSSFLGGRLSSIYPTCGGHNLSFVPPYVLYGPVYPLQEPAVDKNMTHHIEKGNAEKAISSDDSKNVTNVPTSSSLHVTSGIEGKALSDAAQALLTAQQEIGLLEAAEHSQLAIAKISAMFPTVPESHIKDLMRKYHNREAVVISALQVQKHPLATPGPYGTFTPPPMRHFIPTATALMALSSTRSSAASTTSTVGILSTSTTVTSTATSLLHSGTTTTSAMYGHEKPLHQVPTSLTSNMTSVSTTIADQAPPVTAVDRIPSRPIYEKARGTHLFEEKLIRSPLHGQRSSVERSVGRGSLDKSAGSPKLGHSSIERSIGSPFLGRDSPLLSSRASSPHTFLDGSPRLTTRSASDFTRSLMGSPRMDYRYSPRPTPHSPKIKLRYLKGIFPKVEPTVILDVLTQCNYNVKDTSEKLIAMGHEKKETALAPPKLKDRAENKENKAAAPKPSPGPARPKTLTEKHKKKVRNQLTADYPDITPTVVTMALQSVFYDEIRARQVLENMAETDRRTKEALATTPKMSRRSEAKSVTLNLIGSPPTSRRDGVKPSRPTLPRTRINTAWTAAQTVSRGTSTDEDSSFRSDQRARPSGPNTKLHKGPSEGLLLSDYQAWHGPNPENCSGHSKSLAQGPNRTHLRGPSGLARGQNPSMCKGPRGLAKGPQFTQGRVCTFECDDDDDGVMMMMMMMMVLMMVMMMGLEDQEDF